MKPKCPRCGKIINPEDEFCECGHRLRFIKKDPLPEKENPLQIIKRPYQLAINLPRRHALLPGMKLKNSKGE